MFACCDINYCRVLVVSIISNIFGVCIMIIKKTYAENDYIIIDVLQECTVNGLVALYGKCIEQVDPDGAIFKPGDEVEVFMSDLVEVLEE